MPELPEVETIKLGLQKYLIGHTITDVEVRMAKQLSGDAKDIIGAKVIETRRYGKGLVIDLDNGYSIAVHVKMTGQLVYRGPKLQSVKVTKKNENDAKSVNPKNLTGEPKQEDLPGKFTHIIFHLDKDAKLFYSDFRQFGWVKILPTSEVFNQPFFKSLGPEPSVVHAMEGRAVLTIELFTTIIKKYRTPIKPLIMDQTKIAGIGNIYANDALFQASIHPKRPANSLSDAEIKALFNAIEEVLKKGLSVGGASEWYYVDALGRKGRYQDFFLVYRREGKPCQRCGILIEKIQFASRGTYFCPKCQKL